MLCHNLTNKKGEGSQLSSLLIACLVFVMLLWSSADFFHLNFFKKISESQTVWVYIILIELRLKVTVNIISVMLGLLL